MLFAVTGITNRSLRALMTGLLHRPYSMNQASYDLARLARNGLITRVPGRNRYILTRDGLLFAHFYTKVYDHVLRPLMAPDRPNAPPELAAALATLDRLAVMYAAKARQAPLAARSRPTPAECSAFAVAPEPGQRAQGRQVVAEGQVTPEIPKAKGFQRAKGFHRAKGFQRAKGSSQLPQSSARTGTGCSTRRRRWSCSKSGRMPVRTSSRWWRPACWPRPA